LIAATTPSACAAHPASPSRCSPAAPESVPSTDHEAPMRLSRIALLFAGLLGCGAALAGAAPPRTPAVAATPPMGWDSWNFVADEVSDADVRAAADALVSSGMRDAGYVYVNIDDGWQGRRDAHGAIHPNARFPDMKALADYVHARGLKLGIYSSPGSKTCAGYTGSLGHEAQDAHTYASWGIDYLKYDLCSYIQDVMQARAPHDPDQQMRLMIAAYRTMHDALRAAGRPIVFSMCQYGWDASWEWAAGPGIGANLWRTTGDVTPDWDRIYAIAEQQAVLTNKAVIAIDQDPLGRQATRAYAEGETEVWTRPLQGGAMAIAIFNVGSDRHAGTHPFHLDLARLGLHGMQQGTDLWSGHALTLTGDMPIALRHHDVLLVRVERPH